MKKLFLLFFVSYFFGAIVNGAGTAWARSETVTLESYYYPSGSTSSVNTLAGKKAAIGTNYKATDTLNALADDNLIVEGKIGIGTTSPGQRLDVKDGFLRMDWATNDDNAGVLIYRKNRGGAIVNNGSELGSVGFDGYDGANYWSGARIRAYVDGPPSANDMPGRLTFWTTPDGSTAVAERMRIDNAGNVGIGTAAPATVLHVARASNTDVRVRLDNTATGNNTTQTMRLVMNPDGRETASVMLEAGKEGADWSVPAQRDSNLRFFTELDGTTAERMRITSGGNILLNSVTNYAITQGNSGPIGNLVLNQLTGAAQDVGMQLAFGGFINRASGNEGFANIKGAKENATPNNPAGYLAFATRPAGSSALTERVRITSTGNVGIGTMSPTEKLHIHEAAAGTSAYLQLTNATTGAGFRDGFFVGAVGIGSGLDATITNSEAGALLFQTSNTERMRITSTGNVGIGTANPTSKLYVAGTFTATGVKNFEIDHPTRPGFKLVHSSLEGPEAAVFYRGQGRLKHGEAQIRLPGYFESLTRKENRTVQLTAKGTEPYLLSYTDILDGAFKVYGTNPDGEFSWEVKAVRADVEPIQVERPSGPKR